MIYIFSELKQPKNSIDSQSEVYHLLAVSALIWVK